MDTKLRYWLTGVSSRFWVSVVSCIVNVRQRATHWHVIMAFYAREVVHLNKVNFSGI